ncbi:MAG: hypothetical protein EOP90_13065 [Lysobacteraceae bacterium]|nr:MAG: hypothetical protein EOP90_13065 [Xanthomonadaceae bacterium]
MAVHVPALRVAAADARSAATRLGDVVLELASYVPASRERATSGPHAHAERLANAAAKRAALAAGTLALPPGPLGWLTILPELVAIWQIQRQMVADIAAAHGASAELTRSQMLYCLFRHAAAQALRDVGMQVGARLIVRDLPLRTIERVAAKIGVRLSRRVAGRGVSRWLPVIGAIGVGAYAYYDTRQVARTAIALFGGKQDA